MVTKNFCAVVATERYYEAAAVYTSSSLDNNNERHQKWTQMAENLGRGLAERSTELVYGGGSRGLMGVVSLAALEAGGKIQGWLLPEFVQTGEDEYDYPQKPHDRMALDIGD
ncbi:MAG: hypothetical protein MRY79_05720, partial [Alphaproteobacteria bacterium]|nr:hypothetical protein [Alphaproteobacteria bacterium]